MTDKPNNPHDASPNDAAPHGGVANNGVPKDYGRLKRLFGNLCNETLSDEERQELVDRLQADANARRLYMDYMLVHVKLMERARITAYAGCEQLLAKADAAVDKAVADKSTSLMAAQDGGRSLRRAGSSATTKRRIAYAALAASALIAAFGYPLVRGLSGVGGVAAAKGDPSSSAADRAESNGMLYVAQISGLSPDTRWSNPRESHEFLLRVRPGERLEFESGLVELEYFSGARILLQGPCSYIATGPSSGRLIRGELTGHASVGDFTLSTPSAEVIDLGTAFGVVLDDVGNTDVCVLEGKVRVTDAGSSASPADSRLLEKGMAVRVEMGEGIKQLTALEAKRFLRTLPTKAWDNDGVSLVGVLSGLRNDRFRLAGVIAADTGESDRHPWLRIDGPGHSVSKGFQPTSWHPFVDGVFIPTMSGGETLLNTGGQTAKLPPSTGRTWGPVWSRLRLDNDTNFDATEQDFWGTDTLDVVVAKLQECEVGMIGLHANVGITFDLAAIAQQWGKPPVEFRTAVSNLDNSRRRPLAERNKGRKLTASLRLYVDGELRDQRLDLARKDGEPTIRADLRPGDRFLTLVSTDAGQFLVNRADVRRNHDSFDHIVLIDPKISFDPDGQPE